MIVRTRSGPIELRSFSLGSQARYGFNDLRSQAGIYSEDAVRGIPAINRAAKIRATTIGSLRLCCWRDGDGVAREKVDNVWQARLFRKAPNEYQTRYGFWETVEESLAYRGNAYVWKNTDPLTERVVELWALHPDQVQPDPRTFTYTVEVGPGYLDPVGRGDGRYQSLNDDVIMHIRGNGQGGTFVAPSPIQVFKEALEGPIQRQRYEARMWKRGTSLKLAVEFPQSVTPAQAGEWRQMWRETYEGTEETTAIVGGGASVRPIGMTADDASYVEMAGLTVEDASRIMGVPANWLGRETTRAGLFEQDLAMWLRLDLGPELERIESALCADEQLFGLEPPNAASVYPLFDTQDFVRGDLQTEATVAVSYVQAGIWTPDEARAARGLDPLPGGVGAIPQITPVGGAPNPAPAPVPAMNGSGPSEENY